MRPLPSLLAALGLALPACAPSLGDDDTAPTPPGDGDDDDDSTAGDACDAAPTGGFSVGSNDEGFPSGQDLVGTFTGWDPELGLSFEEESGAAWTLQFWFPEGDGTPPEMLLSGIPMLLRVDGEWMSWTPWQVMAVSMADDPEGLVFAAGNSVPWQLPLGEVRAEDGGCGAGLPDWCSCADACRVDRLAFDGGEGGMEVSLAQGEGWDGGGYHFRAWRAHRREGNLCDDAPEALYDWGFWVDRPVADSRS